MTWSKVNIHTSYTKLPALLIIQDQIVLITQIGYVIIYILY
jgi:hypothetical protein